jgi:hypothetical protein
MATRIHAVNPISYLFFERAIAGPARRIRGIHHACMWQCFRETSQALCLQSDAVSFIRPSARPALTEQAQRRNAACRHHEPRSRRTNPRDVEPQRQRRADSIDFATNTPPHSRRAKRTTSAQRLGNVPGRGDGTLLPDRPSTSTYDECAAIVSRPLQRITMCRPRAAQSRHDMARHNSPMEFATALTHTSIRC